MYFMVDPAGTVLAVNAFGAAQLGYTVSDLVGQSMLKVFFPDDKEAAAKNLELCVQTFGQQNKWEIRKVRKDGTLLWVRENAKAARRSDGNLIVLIACEDISDRKRGEQRLAAQYGVTRVLAESDSLAEATPNLLRTICEAMDWNWGALWSVRQQPEHLRCDVVWHAANIDSAEFDAASRELACAPGEGRAGQVWQTRQPLWIADVTKDPGFRRGPAAARAGLHTGLACAILLGREALGIVEFFSRRTREPDEQELATLAAIGSQIGQFIRRKRAEQAIQANEKRFRALIEHAYDVVLLVSAEGTVLYASPSIERVLGYAPEEVIGRNGYDLIDPDHLQESISRFTRSMEQPGAMVTGERLLLHKDGSGRWVENVVVNLLSEPSVQAVVMHLRDITERKQAESALRDSEAKIRRLVDANIIGVFVGDLEGRIIEANDEFLRIVGYNHEDLISGRMRVRDMTPPEWRDRTARTIAEIELLGRTVQPYEKEYFRKDGSRVPVLVGAAAFEERGNQGVAFVLDLTERKRAEAEARESERQHREMQMELAHANRVTTLGELAASIAHEVNQPLGAVVTNAGASLRLLEGEVPDVTEAREALRSIIGDANRAADVIARIRALTRKTPFQKEQFDVNNVILEVAALTRTELDRNRAALRTRLADDLPPVEADRIELQQLILNLIINAIEAMHDSARRDLLVTSTKDDMNNVRVSVCDSGRGLDPAAADRIFQPFYTTKPGGMGMGLAICRSIIERLGGRLSARANAPCGTIFEFDIPIDQATASAEQTASAPAPSSRE